MKHLKSKILIIIASIVAVVAIAVGVYAYVSRISTRGEIEVSTATVTANTTYTATDDSFSWTYTSAGETKQINITTSNQTDVVLHRFYNIQLSENFTSNENLLKAILVYYNNNFIGALNDITTSNPKIEEEYNFIGVSSNKTDNFKFELHQAAKGSIFDNKEMKVTITTYTENSDYYRYIFVNNENDFKRAVDDVNSGLFTEIPSIVLCNNLTLENNYTISEPTIIYLNGSTLNGNLILNDTTATNPNALLKVLGNGSFNVTVTLGTNYDAEGAVTLVKDYIKEVLKNGVSAGSTTNVLGYYSFYGITVTAINRCTFTSPSVVVSNSSNEYYNSVGTIKVNGDENINFKILGSKTELIDETLAHMPSEGDTISLDLFLPTYIPSQNANITWKSSDESIITSTGRISADRLENASVTLYAEIKVNNTIITRRYNFKVSAHNNEINFYKLVQEISPIVINTVRNSASDDPDALYHLPIVNENNDGTLGLYDYRTSFKCPTNTELFDWSAYRNIGLESITYSMSSSQRENFDYITLINGNELYLNNITLNNYANITIAGNFGNDEVYTTNINISITVGSNTQLLEKAFTQVSEELSQISILGNIISTRISSGIHYEKGDFTLSHQFIDSDTNEINEDYTIEYSGAEDIISSITYNSTTQKYEFAINPEYFNEYETIVAFTATVYYRKGENGETSKSRTFYVTVPAALHAKDFGTISIYNSTKYQVVNQLPTIEKNKPTGYTLVGSTLTDTNLDYILLRDIVGDANYLSQYNNNDAKYLENNNYTSADYCTGTEILSYQTSSSNYAASSDAQAYDFARLIEWATGNTRATASSVVSNTNALGDLGTTKANAEDYLNDDEIAVLKQYYKSCTGATDAQWNSLFSEVFNVAPGYIYTDPTLLNTVIVCLKNTLSYFYNGDSRTEFPTIFGKYMEIIQRYAVSTTMVNKDDAAPCQEIYNTRYRWVESSSALRNYTYNGTSYTINYSIKLNNGKYWNRYNFAGGAAGGDSKDSSAANYSLLASDRTSYITENELTILRVFWLNCVSDSGGSTTGLNTSISETQLNMISNVLDNDNGRYYTGFSSSDFNTVGKAILNAFDACLEIPTYFSTDGVSKIIKSFYDKKAYALPSYNSTNTSSFISIVNDNVPYITNADNIKSVLSYFVSLKTLSFIGDSDLAIFLSENGLSTVFARTGLYNNLIETLTMKHVAHSSVNFDLTNIKNFSRLKVLDLSNNEGIISVNELVNINRENYTLVNIEQIGVDYEYQEFAIDNIASSTCTVRYTNSNNENTYTNKSNSSLLAEIDDFNKFISKSLYMTNVVYDDTTNGTGTAVTWRIDEGNEINAKPIKYGGNYPNISSIEEMNRIVSPYYYCNEGFTYAYNGLNTTFIKGRLYKIYYSSNNISFVDLGEYASSTTITEDLTSNEMIDTTGYITQTNTTTSQERVVGTTTTYQTITWYTEDSASSTVTITFNTNLLKVDRWRTFYVGVDGTSLNSTYNDTNLKYFIFLTESEVVAVLNKTYTKNVTVGAKFGTDDGQYYMCYLDDDSLVFVGTTNNPSDWSKIYTTADYHNSYPLTLDGTKIKIGNYYLYENYGSMIYNSSSTEFNYSSSSVESSYNIIFNPSFEIEYNDGTKQSINAYQTGYDVLKLEDVLITITQVESTVIDYKQDELKYYYYTGNDIIYNDTSIKHNSIIAVANKWVYPVATRNRYMTIEGTMYAIKVWYKATSESSKVILDRDDIYSVTCNTKNSTNKYIISQLSKPSDSTVSSDYSDDWLIPLESTWEVDSILAFNYVSYVTNISNDAQTIDSLNKISTIYTNVNNGYNYIYKFTGTTGTESIYKQSIIATTTSYTNNSGYYLKITNNILSWDSYNGAIVNDTQQSMDSILAEANIHFTDYLYGKYYGMYYGYNGTAKYISSGIYVRPGYVYRIMPNVTNTAFEWVEVKSYTTGTSDEILQALGTGVLSVGDICYSTDNAAFGFFNGSIWYKVVLDEKTNVVNLVKFNDVGLSTDGAKTYTKLTNDKLVQRTGDYLGFSGTFTIQISALIRVTNNGVVEKEYIKTYKLKFVGSLYE